MRAAGMQLDRLCLGKIVYPTNDWEDRNSLITALLPLRGVLHGRLPFAACSYGCAGCWPPTDPATPEQLWTACPVRPGCSLHPADAARVVLRSAKCRVTQAGACYRHRGEHHEKLLWAFHCDQVGEALAFMESSCWCRRGLLT